MKDLGKRVLSPILFNLVMDYIIKEVKLTTSKFYIGYRYLAPVSISECAFADNRVIFAKNERELAL